MDIVHPSVREAFREEEIRAIERAVRLEYAPVRTAATSREERKRMKTAMKAELQSRIAGLVEARRKDSDYCL